jgi:hypothetical protein
VREAETLKARVLIDGKCVSEKDLFLNAFRDLILRCFVGTKTVTVKAEDGAGYSIGTYYGTLSTKISIGIGTTPPTRDDFKLENKVAETGDISVSYIENKVIYSATFLFNVDTDITEVGLSVKHSLTATYFMLTRDTFAPERFSAGIPRTVSIEISF